MIDAWPEGWRGQIGFTGAKIDRADQVRTNPEVLHAAMTSPFSRLLRLHGLDPVVEPDGTLGWGTLLEAEPDAELLFLGLLDGKHCFAAIPPAGTPIDARSRAVWRVLPMLRAEEAALYGAARSLIDWHARHGFCAVCGSPTQIFRGGWGRKCSNCSAEHFPRVDPVVIMLAEYDGKLLLGRQPQYPPGRYSALAGFVEPGESLEEAVARELMEEAGVVATSVRYVASQPWPFPSSLMMGCHAMVSSDALTIDTTELEDAIWVDRAGVMAAMNGEEGAPFLAPPPYAIAYNLLEYWLSTN